MFFDQFYMDVFEYFNHTEPEDELFLIQAFFKHIDEEERLVDTVIRSNLEYVMVDGISTLITQYRDVFYKMVKVNKKTEPFIIDLVASSAWRLLSRWFQTGKKETASELSKIYLSAFKSVYIALFDDKSKLNE